MKPSRELSKPADADAYDAFGDQISQSLPDPANGKYDSGSPTTTFTYDLDGNTTSWTYAARAARASRAKPSRWATSPALPRC